MFDYRVVAVGGRVPLVVQCGSWGRGSLVVQCDRVPLVVQCDRVPLVV